MKDVTLPLSIQFSFRKKIRYVNSKGEKGPIITTIDYAKDLKELKEKFKGFNSFTYEVYRIIKLLEVNKLFINDVYEARKNLGISKSGLKAGVAINENLLQKAKDEQDRILEKRIFDVEGMYLPIKAGIVNIILFNTFDLFFTFNDIEIEAIRNYQTMLYQEEHLPLVKDLNPSNGIIEELTQDLSDADDLVEVVIHIRRKTTINHIIETLQNNSYFKSLLDELEHSKEEEVEFHRNLQIYVEKYFNNKTDFDIVTMPFIEDSNKDLSFSALKTARSRTAKLINNIYKEARS